jgi:hypothetical protein
MTTEAKKETAMKTNKLEQAHQYLLSEKMNIVGTCESIARLHKAMHERAAEVDEHAARVGAFVFQARQAAADTPQQREALAQVRSDAKTALAPIFARDLWRELSETCKGIGCEPSANERDVYLAAVAWLFDRPLNDAPEIEIGNCIPQLTNAHYMADLFPPLAILFELDKPKVDLPADALGPVEPGEVVAVGTPVEGDSI